MRVRTYSPFYDLAKTDVANDFTFQITPLPAGLAGDFNTDGVVDLADYVVWRDQLGAAAGTLPNDPSGELVGRQQYTIWKANFGSTSGNWAPSERSLVPEPGARVVCLLWLALIAPITFGRRRPDWLIGR